MAASANSAAAATHTVARSRAAGTKTGDAAAAVVMTVVLFRRGAYLGVPLLEQAIALRRAAVLHEVVVDELDLRELRRSGRRVRVLVRRHLVGDLRGGPDVLRFRRQRPVVPLLRVVHVLRALDDAHAADL